MDGQAPPVKAGEEYEVDVEAVGGKGDGIARVKGFVLFVPGTKKGDHVRIRVTKVLTNVGFAEVAQQLEKQPRQQKYATITKEAVEEEQQSSEHYEDTDDFGHELEEE